MNQKAYQASYQLSIGEVKTELKPAPELKDNRQVNDAMLVAAHDPLVAWVIDNTTDPGTKGGKQEQIRTVIEDGGRQIAELVVSVPTTQNYSKALFEGFVQQGLMPAVQQTFRSYPSTRPGQKPSQGQIAQHILPEALEQTSRVTPKQLQKR